MPVTRESTTTSKRRLWLRASLAFLGGVCWGLAPPVLASSAGITATPGLALLGKSNSTIVSYAALGADVYALADRLEARGWTVDRQQRPASIHLTVTANHAAIVDDYIRDVRAALAEVRANPALAKSGTAPMYGMAAKMPVRRLVAANVRKVIADLYSGGAQ